MNITEDYVSFETAKLLKEKGFDEPCRAYWDDQPKLDVHTLFSSVESIKNSERVGNTISGPTHQMAMKWLREVHNLHVWIGHSVDKGLSWYYEIHGISDGKVKHIGGIQCGSYEVAVESALKYSLENLI